MDAGSSWPSSIETFTINGGTSIGSSEFYGCDKLTSITIPSTVQSIGNDAFNNCYNLTSSSFSGPSSLQTFILNCGTSIGSYEFSGCSNLTSITLNNNITSIGDYAFENSGLTSITVPSTVTSIGENAFESCSNLTNITAPVGISYSSWPSSVETFTINGGTSINNYEFSGCSNLTSITLNNNITSIGDHAFESSGLTSITIPTTVQSVGSSVFDYCNSDLVVSAPLNLISNSSFNVNYLIITTGTTITSSNMSNLNNVQYLTLPDSMTSIADNAFKDCYNLQSISIPSNLIRSGSEYEKWGVSASIIHPRTAE